MIKLFKNIQTMKFKPLSQHKKHQLLLIGIGGAWYIEKMSKKLQPLEKQKLIKKSQEKDDKIEMNIQTDNRIWNYWKFQIHWNMFEWVNPISKILRKNPIRLLQRNTILIEMIEQLIVLAIQNLKH